jgi:hypothetical protein
VHARADEKKARQNSAVIQKKRVTRMCFISNTLCAVYHNCMNFYCLT